MWRYQAEFIQTGTGGKTDFVGNFIEKYGEGLHHLTINLKEFDQTLRKLRADGVRIVDENKNWRGESEFFILAPVCLRHLDPGMGYHLIPG